jgi:PAS domain S-box-containing protein
MNIELTQLVEDAGSPAIATDRANRIIQLNRLARELFEYRKSELVGENVFEFLEARDFFGNRLSNQPLTFWEMISRGESIRSFSIDARKASGEYQRVAVSVVVVLNGRPQDYRVIYLLRPVLRRRKADEAIEALLARNRSSGESILEARSDDKSPLTPRQREVLRLLADGSCPEKIAGTIGVSLNTVRSHIQNIFERLGVHSQLEAVARAFRDQLI